MVVFLTLMLCGLALTPVATTRVVVRRSAPPFDPVDAATICELLAAALRSGMSIPSALTAVDSALAEERAPSGLDVTARLLTYGMSWEEAWEHTAARFHPAADALQPAWEDGAAPVALLERTSDTLRASSARRARERAADLGVKLALPLGLCFLPAFILLGVVPIIGSLGIDLFS